MPLRLSPQTNMELYLGYGLNLGWRGPIIDYIGFWRGPMKGYTTNLVQGSYSPCQDKLVCMGLLKVPCSPRGV